MKPLLDALFLDRDGTLIVEKDFLRDPRGVRLTRGAARALRPFVLSGTRLFVVTNQSGIARGKLGWPEVRAVNAEVARRLLRSGIPIAEFLICPHYPGGIVPEYAIECRCRKPGTALHEDVLARHGFSPSRCAVAGDKWDDIGAGAALGMAQIHVLTGHGREHRRTVRERAPECILASTLAEGLAVLAREVEKSPR
ncbi:MAG: HAD-IIIA family hydrolase [Thermoanaerobaculia bacterium]|nr:HAD-IIIA family hydrolase [Thermoanaerobaculia bacterium]